MIIEYLSILGINFSNKNLFIKALVKTLVIKDSLFPIKGEKMRRPFGYLWCFLVC